ncbi:hypothetical protein [Herbidospora sp. NBRC 101105]|uniref:hypothetical protein n=1 Tax=Herbidospora sp. NBRC 101105 TaxID=3032195 RepID=UPI0024A3052D|nr:hypothetical protein [Herbidospora sp. NBRC 101105]GLX92531.1 hypothetical protein Hesp01_04810 [Herbidospora sp. NBRC 101105]
MTYSEETARPSSISITVDADRETVGPGDRVTYTTTVRNLGTGDTPALDVSHALAPGLVLVSARPEGRLVADGVHWTTRIPAGADARFTVTVDVGGQAGARPLTAVACVARAGDDTPLVCATGAATVRAEVPFWWGAVGVLGVLLVVAVLVALRRRYPFDRFR